MRWVFKSFPSFLGEKDHNDWDITLLYSLEVGFSHPDINFGASIPHNTLHLTLSSECLQCNNENNIVFIILAYQKTSTAIIVAVFPFCQLCAVIYHMFLCRTLCNLIISLPNTNFCIPNGIIITPNMIKIHY